MNCGLTELAHNMLCSPHIHSIILINSSKDFSFKRLMLSRQIQLNRFVRSNVSSEQGHHHNTMAIRPLDDYKQFYRSAVADPGISVGQSRTIIHGIASQPANVFADALYRQILPICNRLVEIVMGSLYPPPSPPGLRA